jgi:hypothetical protein
MVAQTAPASNPIVDKEAWLAALRRATAGRIVVYRTPHYGCYHVTSASQPGVEYTVSTCGPRWHDLCCTCPGARRGRVCLHMSATAFARRHHVYAVRPAARENASTKHIVCEEVAA